MDKDKSKGQCNLCIYWDSGNYLDVSPGCINENLFDDEGNPIKSRSQDYLFGDVVCPYRYRLGKDTIYDCPLCHYGNKAERWDAMQNESNYSVNYRGTLTTTHKCPNCKQVSKRSKLSMIIQGGEC